MNNFLINNLEKTIANSNVLNSQFQDVQGQLAFVFEFLLDENKQKGIFLIAENDDFNILQIFVRYPQTVSKENIPQALVALNRINSISIAGFLMLSEENDIMPITRPIWSSQNNQSNPITPKMNCSFL
jgi:hypothetical protein